MDSDIKDNTNDDIENDTSEENKNDDNEDVENTKSIQFFYNISDPN